MTDLLYLDIFLQENTDMEILENIRPPQYGHSPTKAQHEFLLTNLIESEYQINIKYQINTTLSHNHHNKPYWL